MKKFTNISGAKVGVKPEVPKVSNEELELSNFKYSIMKLMDDFLTIQSYGSARPEIMIPTRIVGKEIFIEALTDMLSQKSNKEIVKVLESLKLTNNDWKSIEQKIDDIQVEDKNIKEEKKINDILNKWGSDEETLKIYMNKYTEKIDSIEVLSNKYRIVESMKSNHPFINVILDSFTSRSKNLNL